MKRDKIIEGLSAQTLDLQRINDAMLLSFRSLSSDVRRIANGEIEGNPRIVKSAFQFILAQLAINDGEIRLLELNNDKD